MKAFVITLKGNDVSEKGAKTLKESSQKFKNPFDISTFEAVTADMAETTMKGNGVTWTYPWDQQMVDMGTGLKLSPYQTAYPARRMACFMSHYILWYKSFTTKEPILILEHDAVFIKTLNPNYILDSKFNIVGINNPLMATRRAKIFHEKVQGSPQEIQLAPTIDDFDVPQGIAGNSAYIIKPSGAENLIETVKEYGAWPNDAIMCRQLIEMLGVTREYYTKVQGLPSTTTG